MTYPDIGKLYHKLDLIKEYMNLEHELESSAYQTVLSDLEKGLEATLDKLKSNSDAIPSCDQEPDNWKDILLMSSGGPEVDANLLDKFDKVDYRNRLEGALLGRFAGCLLGVPVEMWSIDQMKSLAREYGDAFPPVDYWSGVHNPDMLRYNTHTFKDYAKENLSGVPVDDDIIYTLLGLLVLERYGVDFSVEQLGEAWKELVPLACTAEEVAIRNLEKGISIEKVGFVDNPYREWIGADIRSDPWAYVSPGMPWKAAHLAWKDGYLTHRRSGIYGEMFFSAAISAAFSLDDPMEALQIGLKYIPPQSRVAQAIQWALDKAPNVDNYEQARRLVDQKFPGMSVVHTINNACLTVFGIAIGGTDYTKMISETIAMGMDNDCTGATAGSLVGAIIGKDNIPGHWTAPFNDTVYSYLNDHPKFSINNVIDRFWKIGIDHVEKEKNG